MKYHILDRNSLSCSSKVWPSLKQHQQGHQFLMDLASLQMQLNGNLKKPDIIQKELGADLQRECCAQSCGLGLQRPQIHTQPFLPSRQRSSSAIGFSCASLFAGISSLQNAVSPSDSHDLGVDLGKHRTSTKLPQGLLPTHLAPHALRAWLQRVGFQKKPDCNSFYPTAAVTVQHSYKLLSGMIITLLFKC